MRDDYLELVAREAAGRLPEGTPVPEELTGDLDRWYRALVELVEDLNSQLSSFIAAEADIKSERHSPGDFHARMSEMKRKRAGVVNFKRKVDRRLREVKAKKADKVFDGDRERAAWKRLTMYLLDQFDHNDRAEMRVEIAADIELARLLDIAEQALLARDNAREIA